ncbi:hypothetical protein WJX81_003965 [Elliptochloris bilobata]|uniref:Uncharacterized protein n=1 Tax=Elliptochloris bilobata TaxID=381761 RepID=A0AAW1QMV7_9CHLO
MEEQSSGPLSFLLRSSTDATHRPPARSPRPGGSLPLPTGGNDYCRVSRTFEYGCSCKEQLLGGRIRMDVPGREIEYQKHLCLGPGHGIGLSARCSVAGALAGRFDELRPVLGLQYEMGSGAAMWAGDQFDLRQKLRLTRNLALEVCGAAQLPVPSARYSMGADRTEVSVGDGAFHLHVAQINAILHL